VSDPFLDRPQMPAPQERYCKALTRGQAAYEAFLGALTDTSRLTWWNLSAEERHAWMEAADAARRF
jgi:hypothetical protein